MRDILSISLPKELSAELSRLAREMGRNKSDIVRESIGQFLWDARFARTRKTLSAKAKRKGIVSEEDLFRAVS